MKIGLGIGIPFIRNYISSIFDPSKLFTGNTNGVWYDPSDLTTLYRDAAGTQPVTAVEQPVGLMLDKSGKSPTTWLQKIADPSLTTTTGWSNPAVFSGGKYISGNSSYSLTATIGKLYRYTYVVSQASSGGLALYVCGVGVGSSSPIAAGTYSGTVIATSTKVFEFYNPGWGWTGQIDSVSVEELQGNHAFNPSGNSANFPVLSARYNLLTKTEEFDDAAVWALDNSAAVNPVVTANYGVAPNGTQTADRIVLNKTGGVFSRIQQSAATTLGTSYIFSVWLKTTSAPAANVGIRIEGTGLNCAVTSTWQQFSVSTTATGASLAGQILLFDSISGNDETADILAWGADLRVTNDALNQPAYQRVNTATDYDTVGFKPYLRFNGTNQWLQTNSIDLTYCDKMFVSAGVRKLSDSAPQGIVELSLNADANNGSFWVRRDYQYLVRSGGGTNAVFTDSVSAPRSDVIALIADLAAPLTRTRLNGVDGNTNANPSGGGNFGNYPLYIGARGGSSLWFNGRLYSLIVAGKLANAVEITETEKYVNGKTAAY